MLYKPAPTRTRLSELEGKYPKTNIIITNITQPNNQPNNRYPSELIESD